MKYAPLTDKQMDELYAEIMEYKEARRGGYATYLDELEYEVNEARFYLEIERRKYSPSSATLVRLEKELDEARTTYNEARWDCAANCY